MKGNGLFCCVEDFGEIMRQISAEFERRCEDWRNMEMELDAVRWNEMK